MEQLIRDLTSSKNQGRPDAINVIQRQIQRLQREPTAWQTGLDLLSSQDQVLQFYGALTLNLKVNADWDIDKIGEDRNQISQLIEQLITSYVKVCLISDSDVVVSKLASTLAAVFAKPSAAWAHPCRHVLACALAGRYVSQSQTPCMSEMLGARATIPGHALKAVLRLALALQEELNPNTKNHVGHRAEIQLSNNASDVWHLVQFSLATFCARVGIGETLSADHNLQVETTEHYLIKIIAEALQQIPAWSRHITNDTSPNQLFSLFVISVGLTLHLLEQPLVADYVMPCLTSLQIEHSRLLASAVPNYCGQINKSSAASRWMTELLTGNFSAEANSYVEFLEAVVSQVDATTDDYLENEDLQEVLDRTRSLTRCKGAAMVEDEVCQAVLEMWTTITEGYSDWSEPSQFDDTMVILIKDVCLATLVKVQYPAEELDKQTATWEEDDYTRFEDYRFQASDFFQTAIGVLGSNLADNIARSISQSPKASWSEFEATLFVLTAVSDALSNEPEKCDPSLNEIFSSSRWNEAISQSSEVPSRVRRAVIRLLAETTSYLQRNPQYLIGSLDFLFRTLQVKGHSNHAAKAIYNLCDSQRSFLVQALPQFLATVNSLEHIPIHSRSKVLSSVAALVQALPSESEKIEPLKTMLQLVQGLETQSSSNRSLQDEDLPDPLFERVFMLAAIAKGLQSPADTPIDLESTDTYESSFWIDGSGRELQQGVLQMLSEPWSVVLDHDKSDLVTAACDFLKAGFKEQHPSPMKFSSSISTELLSTLTDLKNPNLDQTLNTVSCYVSANAAPSPDSSTEADVLLSRVLTLTREATTLLNDPSQRSSFSAPTSILDFVVRSLPKYGLHIFTHASASDILETIIAYAIVLLHSQIDTLPRRSGAAFFTAFLDLTDPTSTISTNPIALAVLHQMLDKYCPTILGITLHLLAGECARSEIESLCQLLRAFVAKQPLRAKTIMRGAMDPESGILTSKAVAATRPEQRARFVAQVEGLRGGRKTNEIVRDFWVSCRGGQFGYVT